MQVVIIHLPLLSYKSSHGYVSSFSFSWVVSLLRFLTQKSHKQQQQIIQKIYLLLIHLLFLLVDTIAFPWVVSITCNAIFNGCESKMTIWISMASTRVLRLSFSMRNESRIHTISQIWMLNVVISFLGVSSRASRLFFFFVPFPSLYKRSLLNSSLWFTQSCGFACSMF